MANPRSLKLSNAALLHTLNLKYRSFEGKPTKPLKKVQILALKMTILVMAALSGLHTSCVLNVFWIRKFLSGLQNDNKI